MITKFSICVWQLLKITFGSYKCQWTDKSSVLSHQITTTQFFMTDAITLHIHFQPEQHRLMLKWVISIYTSSVFDTLQFLPFSGTFHDRSTAKRFYNVVLTWNALIKSMLRIRDAFLLLYLFYIRLALTFSFVILSGTLLSNTYRYFVLK